MNNFDRAMICFLLLLLPMISIATATALSQDNLLPNDDIDSAYQEDADDDRETQLKKERIRSVMAELGPKKTRVMLGQEQVCILLNCQQRLATALLDFHQEPNKIISILEQYVEVAKEIEADRKLRLASGLGPPDDSAQASYLRADAELQLLRAKQKFNVVEGNDQPAPIRQLENAPPASDHFQDRPPSFLDQRGDEELPELNDGIQRQAPPDTSIDEWMKGTYSPAPI